ncbi:hypothetical protein CK203_116023 [Vitis vinifera]|uniref:Uncharacterized protein n=1 Tax=Vitis vinifera TaxID=29760 RepID=A0A438FEG0_VITVI|nr:hypothetical protein CK203_116023 [Vitis vinifera]
MTTNPLHTHDTRVVPPPPRSVHLIEFSGNEIHDGVGQRGSLAISLYKDSDFSGYIHGQQHVLPMTPFILFPEEYGPVHRDVQIVTRSGRVAQPPPVSRPFAGIDVREDVHREDDEILWQLRTTEGSGHIRPLYISVACLGHRVSTILLDNGFALNVYPLATAIALGFSPSDFGPSTKTIRAYDETQRTVM